MKADVTENTKPRKRMEGAAAAERMKSGDNSSAEVDSDPICLASFGGNSTVLPALLCSRDDALVDDGAAAPKPCLSPVKMRTQAAADSLFPTGISSTATRTTFHQSPRWFCPSEEIHLRTSNQYATNYSSFWKMKVLQTKSMQTLVFGPGDFKGPLRARFWERGARCFVGGFLFGRRLVAIWNVFGKRRSRNIIFPKEEIQARRTYCS